MNDKTNIQRKRFSVSQHPRGYGRRAFWAIVLLGGMVTLFSYVPGCTGHSRHQRGFLAEDVPQRIHKGTEWALKKVDATPEQRHQVVTILEEVDLDVIRWQEKRRALKDRFIQALQAEQVDPDELATIKSASVTLTDQALSRTTEVVVKVSEILSPAQRRELVANWGAYQ